MLAFLLSALVIAVVDDPELVPIAVEVPSRSGPVKFEEVTEILLGKCVGCHDSASARGRLVLEDREGMLAGGKRGPAVVPGRSDESLLIRLAAHRENPTMPPDPDRSGIADGPLTPGELGLIKLWIDAGAVGSEVNQPEAPVLGALPDGVHPIVALDVTPDGRLVAAGRGDRVIVVETETGRVVGDLGEHRDVVQSVRFSPGGDRLAAGSYGVVTVWAIPPDLNSVDTPSSWPEPTRLSPLTGRVTAIDFRPDGGGLAVGSGEPGRSGVVSIWDFSEGAWVRRFEGLHSDAVLGLRYSPDGLKLATASADRLAKVIDLEGEPLLTLEGHDGHVVAINWSPDGARVLTAGAEGVLKLWNSETGAILTTGPPLGGPLSSADWAPNGGRNALSVALGPLGARILGTRSLSTARTLTGPIGYAQSVASSSDGTVVASGGDSGTLAIWKGTRAEPIQVLWGPGANP